MEKEKKKKKRCLCICWPVNQATTGFITKVDRDHYFTGSEIKQIPELTKNIQGYEMVHFTSARFLERKKKDATKRRLGEVSKLSEEKASVSQKPNCKSKWKIVLPLEGAVAQQNHGVL